MDKASDKPLTDEQVDELVKQSREYMRKLMDDIKENKVDPRIVTPAVVAMYGQLTKALGMEIDEALSFAVQSIGEAYGVNVIKASPDEVDEMREMFDGSSKVH